MMNNPKINPQIIMGAIGETKFVVTWGRSLKLFRQRNKVLKIGKASVSVLKIQYWFRPSLENSKLGIKVMI